MAIADPQTLTINAVPKTLNETSTTGSVTVYQTDDTLVKLTISHAYGRRTRRSIRVDLSKISPDLFVPATNVSHSMTCNFIVDEPKVGFSTTEKKQLADALTAWLTATSGAALTQVLGGQH